MDEMDVDEPLSRRFDQRSMARQGAGAGDPSSQTSTSPFAKRPEPTKTQEKEFSLFDEILGKKRQEKQQSREKPFATSDSGPAPKISTFGRRSPFLDVGSQQESETFEGLRRRQTECGTTEDENLVTGEAPTYDFIDSAWIEQLAIHLVDLFQLDLDDFAISSICEQAVAYYEAYGLLGRPTTDFTALRIATAWFNRRYSLLKISDHDINDAPPPRELLNQIGVPLRDDEHAEWIERTDKPVEQRQDHQKDTMAQFSADAMTPNLGQFLTNINGFLKEQNEASLADWLVLEPPFNSTYVNMIQELKQAYPKSSEDALEEKCSGVLTVASKGLNDSPSWTWFTRFMVQYLGYLRDVDADPNKYLETYELLYELLKRATSALNHPGLGHIMLQTVISCAKLICRLAIGLDQRPELIAHLKSNKPGGEDGGQETLPERAAESIRQALTNCLNDRASGLNAEGKPEGKKRGIYIIANICLKIFFQCRKTRNAEMIFTTIRNNSPPLDAYPKAEKVTYLYYLGRYWFQNNHFPRAQLALQEAYNETPANPQCTRQRRHILVYLITCNIIMGRFPSQSLFERPEAQGLQDRFLPILQAIRTGNLALFRQYLDLDSPHSAWFLHFRILLPLRNRCEVLVWRSLIRKIWLLSGTRYEASGKAAPHVDINLLVAAFRYLEKQAQKPQDTAYIDPDFDEVDYADEDPEEMLPTISSLESIISSLVDQGFLKGFIAHRQCKFAISGAKQAGGNALAAGFPSPWRVIQQKMGGNDEVPGWKKTTPNALAMATGGLSGGMVVNLSGARAAGAA